MTGFTYLASPYSHPDPDVRHQRYLHACRAAAWLMRESHAVFSPIAHSHPIEIHGLEAQESGDFWKRQDIPILRHASQMVVLMLTGWNDSAGIKWEIETAESLLIPIKFLNWTSYDIGFVERP